MCKPHPAQIPSEAKSVLEEAAPSEMDPHLLLDALTLSAVAILLITLLVAKLVKKQKKTGFHPILRHTNDSVGHRHRKSLDQDERGNGGVPC